MTNPYNEGDILASCWGYGQTNATFYEVTKVTPKSVKLTMLGNVETANPDGIAMCGTAVPNRADRRGTRMYRVRPDGRVKVRDWGTTASLWGGEPVFISWWH